MNSKVLFHPMANGQLQISYLKEIKKISAYGTITEVTPEILTQLIHSITIDKKGKPTIHYRFTLPSKTI